MASGGKTRRRLTGRGWILAALAVIGLTIGFVFGILDLVRLALVLLGAVVLGYALQWRPMPPLEVSRTLPRQGVQAGKPANVLLRAKGMPAAPGGYAIGEDITAELGHSIDVPMSELTIRDSLASASYQVNPAKRGPAMLGPTIAARTDVFGLARTTKLVAPEQIVIVWPRLYPVAHRLNLGPGSGSSARQRSKLSEEDVIPREYRAGDDYRRIHWPATARAGRLMVRSDEQSLAAAGMLHLALSAAPDADTAEEIVSAAASVGVALLDAGHMVALSLDRPDESLTQWGPADRTELLDYLACLDLPERQGEPAVFAALGDLLVLLAPANDATALEALRAATARRRRLAVIVGAEPHGAVARLQADGVAAIAWRDVIGEESASGQPVAVDNRAVPSLGRPAQPAR